MNWYEIKNQSDIKNLLNHFGYFHDSCLKELHMWTNTYVNENLVMNALGELDTNVRMLFQRQYKSPSAIEIFFEGVTGIHIMPSPENHDSIIRDAIILQHKGNYYWANDFDWHPEKYHENVSWISAKKIKWRDASNWMGKQNRYGMEIQ